jgi:CHAT domain-containing protein/tetratricopeptide (TPR) repeat protein
VCRPADPPAASAAALAQLWLVGTAAPAGAQAAAVGWALKDICYGAFRSEPPLAARAAAALQAMLRAGIPDEQRTEVHALGSWTAGIVNLTQGEMASAVLHFDAAATGLRAAGQTDAAAQTQVPKIMALSMLGQHEQAAACAEETQKTLQALGNLAAAARVSLNMGSMLARRDLYAQSARHFREAAVLFARLRDHEHSVLADIGLANAFTDMGDFEEARRVYARARMRADNQGLGTQLALVDESVALLDLARGQYRQALAGLESARRRYEALSLPTQLAIAEKLLADIYLELRLLPEALVLFDAAVAKFERLSSPDEQALALAQRGRTQALLAQATATASFEAAAALFAAQGNAVGGAAVALARAELALAQLDTASCMRLATLAQQAYAQASHAEGQTRAEVLHAQGLLQSGQTALAKHDFTGLLARARAQQQLIAQVPCLTGLGEVALNEGDFEKANAHFEAAIELFEDQRRALPGDEMRSAFLRDHLRPYEALLRMALASGDAEKSLAQLERFRARALGERLQGGDARAHTQAEHDPQAQPLRERLNWLYRHVQRLHDEGGSAGAFGEEMRQLERELLERARRQRLAQSHTSGDVQGTAFDLRRLQEALQPQDFLVEYGHLDNELFACVVSKTGVLLVRQLAQWSQVQEAVRALRFQIDALRHGAAPMQKHMHTLTARVQTRLAQVQALLWAPLADHVQGAQRIALVLSAELGAVPFCALPVADTCLGECFQLCIVASARAAVHGLQRMPLPARRVLALGESTRLPHTASEVQAVRGLFAQGHSFVGADASSAQLRAHGGQADVLHLACHAQFRSDNPRFSALHLADGALTVEQVEGLCLAPCTVVLSACETGVAEIAIGDEQVGLVRAFLLAGASRVLASLWPVDDAVTASFMAQFYAQLVRGQAPAQALQTAQAATRQQHPHPSFWAAFTLYGGW